MRLFDSQTIVVSGTAAPSTKVAALKWGPSFGQAHSTDGKTFGIGVDLNLPYQTALGITQGVGTNVTMPSLAIVASSRQLAAGVTIPPPALALTASTRQLAVGTHVSEVLALTASTRMLAVGSNITMPKLSVVASSRQLAVGSNVSMPTLTVVASSRQLAAGVRGATASWLLGTTAASGAGAWKASKDIWYDNIAVCVTTGCRNLTNLQVDGTVLTRKDINVAWDLSAIASTKARVQSATLIMNALTTGLAGAASSFRLNRVSTAAGPAGETWFETGSSCARCGHTVTSVAGATQSWTVTATLGEKALVLNAGWLTRIQNRLGKGFCTMQITGVVGAARTFQSKDSGAGSSLGPRLVLNFNTT